jgi:hypothetical protein
MKLAISQPTFLPWIGYFALLKKVENFIFLDHVQFEKRSWQQRNYIQLNGQPHLITIPVKTKARFKQKISDVEICDYKEIVKIKNKIFLSYKKARYFNDYYENISNIFDNNKNFLLNLNIELIKFFTKELKINVNFTLSSFYEVKSNKEDLIFDLCKKINCEEYVTTIGAKKYLGKFKNIPGTDIKISYFEFIDIKYFQNNDKFIPKLSILDLLFNEGKNSTKILEEGFRIINK